MRRLGQWQCGILATVLGALVLGCAPIPSPGAAPNAAPPASQPTGPKRITAALMGNPIGAVANIIGGGSGGGTPGARGLQQLVAAGLNTVKDNGAQVVPQLADAVPSFENGLWTVQPDGTMQTTWHIRPGATWHDGEPLTSADVLFSSTVEQDKALPAQRNPGYSYVARLETPDPQTVTVVWKTPYIQADQLFITEVLPSHLLQAPYQVQENKDAFIALPYWNEGFVGAGPYRVQEWVRGSHAVLQAFDGYALGRPKIDEIDLQFLADESGFMAAILAGTVDVTIGKSITHEQAMEIKTKWAAGHIVEQPETVMKMWPQFVDPTPAVILDARFRKALVYAINRQEMVDTLVGHDASTVAQSILMPTEPLFPEGEGTAVHYDFDPALGAQMIEQLGYTRGPDGVFHDSAGQPLSVEINVTDEAQNMKPMFAVADYWTRIGINATTLVIPTQRQDDREYRATFSGFSLQGSTSGLGRIAELTSAQARLPENNYTGRNYPRYMNPEFDALVARFESTIPMADRLAALQQVIQHMTDQLVMVPLYYVPMTTMISNRVQGAGFDPTWNVEQWDIQ